LRASDSLHGFAVSDRFEAGRALSYAGKALAALLDPAFAAMEPFTLRSGSRR